MNVSLVAVLWMLRLRHYACDVMHAMQSIQVGVSGASFVFLFFSVSVDTYVECG